VLCEEFKFESIIIEAVFNKRKSSLLDTAKWNLRWLHGSCPLLVV